MEKSWNSSLKSTGDYKELCPEFYHSSAHMLNLKEMQAIGSEVLCDIELPTWAQNAEHFIETMREALESDYVSENLHHWIDLIFGLNQKASFLFPETCYEVNWGSLKANLEKDAFEIICKEFGQCPEQLFFTPHLKRIFRQAPEIVHQPDTPHQVWLLEKYIKNLQEVHQVQINEMLEGFHKAKKKLNIAHAVELENVNKQILELKELIQKATDGGTGQKIEGGYLLAAQNSIEGLKPTKSPNLLKRYESEHKGQEPEISKTRIESAKKNRKVQSKTPTKPF